MGFLDKLKTFYNLYKFRIIIAIAFVGVLSVMGALKWYGVFEYKKGVESCTSQQKTAVIDTMRTNNQIWNETNDATSKITDLDAAGSNLGILRPDTLR